MNKFDEAREALDDIANSLRSIKTTLISKNCETEKPPSYKIRKCMDGFTFEDLLKPDGKKYTSFYYWKTSKEAEEAAKEEHKASWGKSLYPLDAEDMKKFLEELFARLEKKQEIIRQALIPKEGE